MEYYGGLLGVESHGKYSWMVHQKGAIRCYDLEKKRFVHQLDFLKDQLKPDDRVVLKILDNGDFWLMWDRGVGYYDVYNKKWNQISGIQLGHYSWFTIISKYDGSIIQKITIPSKEQKTLVIFGDNDQKVIPTFFATTATSDNWILMNLSSDTLYSYSPNGHIKPFIVRTPSIYSMDTEIFLFVEGVTSRYYFMRTVEKKLDIKTRKIPVSRLVYDKQEDSIFKYQIYNTDFLYQRPIYWISSINQDIANWYPFDAPELIEAYKEGKLKGRLNEIAAKLNEDSNPVIMLIKYKK